jgi:hypothetical protein
VSQIPSPKRFFLDIPPYSSFEIGPGEFKDVLQVQFFLGTLDTYCVECQRESVFQRASPPLLFAGFEPPELDPHDPNFVPLITPVSVTSLSHDEDKRAFWPPESWPEGEKLSTPLAFSEMEPYAVRDRVFHVKFTCTRNTRHFLYFVFRVEDRFPPPDCYLITKIGQYPSLADLHLEDVKKYRKLLGDEKYREFTKAIGLNAHGVGIGAFVYLRRILEDLIDTAKNEAAKEPAWDEQLFGQSRIKERIQLLQGKLPQFLVENRNIYAILSRGIHELTEQQCLDAFGVVRVGIELILDEKLQEKERAEKIAGASKELSKIEGEVKGSSRP